MILMMLSGFPMHLKVTVRSRNFLSPSLMSERSVAGQQKFLRAISIFMDYAAQFNDKVFYNPTTIDTDLHHNTTADHKNIKFIFGWTGSHSTHTVSG